MKTSTFAGTAAAARIVWRPGRGAADVVAVCALALGFACGPLAVAPIAAADSCDVGFQDTGKSHGDVTVCEPIPGLATSHHGSDSPKQDAELSFLQQLPAYGVGGLDATGQGKAIELAYLLCELDSAGSSGTVIQAMDDPVMATGVLKDARATNMCKVKDYVLPALPELGQYGVDPSAIADVEQRISDNTTEFGGSGVEATEGRNPVTGGSVNPNQPCARTDSC